MQPSTPADRQSEPDHSSVLAELTASGGIEYVGDDPRLQDQTRLTKGGAWEALPPWPEADPIDDWEVVRRATDEEIIRALAAELLYVRGQRKADYPLLNLGRAVAKALPDALAKSGGVRAADVARQAGIR